VRMEGVVLTGEVDLVVDPRHRMMAVDLPGDHLAKVAAGGVHVMKGVMGEAGMVADPRLRMMAVDLQGGLLPKGADGGVRIMKEAGLMGLLLLLTNL
jgi:hypothetical protein